MVDVDAKVRPLSVTPRCPLCHNALGAEPAATCPACRTAYHAACVAELEVACATLGCVHGPALAPPRASLAAVADEPPSPLWPLVFTWLLFALAWPVGLVTWGWALKRARRHPRLRVAVTLLASPFVAIPLCTVVDAVQSYVRGTAVVTLPPERFRTSTGLDPLVRCEEQRAGVVFGPDLLSRGTNELVLHDLARLFGPMAGGYDGPLPTGAEAGAALEGGLLGTRSADGRWVTDAQGFSFDFDFRAELARDVLGYHPDGPRRVRFAWLEARSLLVALEGRPREAVLCDLRAKRPVARIHLRSFDGR